MKKRLCILLSSLLLCALAVNMVYAQNITSTKYGTVDTQYTYTLPGTYSKLTADATLEKCYATLQNTSSSMIRAEVRVSEMLDGDLTGVSKGNSSSALMANAVVATGGLARKSYDTRYGYKYYGCAYQYTSGNTVLDTLTYNVYQRAVKQ